jgi:thiamine biosynthesis lipoprotein
MTHLLLSVGGNVCAIGGKIDGSSWRVGIQNPDLNSETTFVEKVVIKDKSVVTSGDYQRYYTVEGKEYHHIIDPETLYPALNWKAVSIICTDSGLGDALSTALFLLNREEGQKLLDKYDAQAMWVDQNGETYYSPGFKELIRT